MSPVLFNIVADQLLSKLENCGKGIKIGERYLPGIAYADDLILFSRSDKELNELIAICEELYCNVGLSINEAKSMVMGSTGPVLINGEQVQVVNSITYLGATLDRKGSKRLSGRDIVETIEKI